MTSRKSHYLQRELYERIKKDERIFQFLEHAALDGIWYWDLEQPEHEWMSQEFWRTLGYKPEEKEHKAAAWQDIIYPEDLEVAKDNLERHLADPNHPYDQVVRYRHREGSTVFVRCRGMAIRDKTGKPIRLLGAHNDVTTIKKAEQRVRKSKEVLQRVLESQAFFVITTDLNGCYTYLNDNFCSRFQVNREQVLGKSSLDSLLPEDHHKCLAAIDSCLKSPGTPFYAQLRKPGPDGVVSTNQWEFTAISDETGQPAEILCLGYDATNEVRSEEYFSALVQTLDDAVITLGEDGRILYTALNWLSDAGMPAGSMIGQRFQDFCPEEDHSRVRQLIAGELRSGAFLEHRLKIPSGMYLWMETKATYSKELNQTILVCRDIRERRANQQRMREMAELLEQTQRTARIGGWKLNLEDQSTMWTQGVYDIYEMEPLASGKINLERALTNYPPEEQKKISQKLARAIETQKSLSWTSRFFTDSGKARWVQIQINPDITNGQVRNLSGLMMDVTERVEAEQALLRKSKMQQLLMNMSANYINLPLDRVEQAIQHSLEKIGRFVQADRSYIFEFNHQQQTASNTYEWCAENIAPQIDQLQDLPLSLSPNLMEQLNNGQPYYIPDVEDFPEGQEKEMLKAQDIQSLLAVPMYHDKRCLGFVGFDSVRQVKVFTEDERNILELFSELLVNVQQRSKTQQELENRKRQLQKLTENVPGAIYQFEMSPDGHTSMPFVSDGVSNLHPELSPELLRKNAGAGFAIIHREDLPAVQQAIQASAKKMIEFSAEYRTTQPDGSIKWQRATSMPERREDGTIVWYGIFQDITRQKELEAIKNQAAQLEARNKELEQFAYVASHDLQEPLRTVRNFAQLANHRLSSKLGEEGQQYMEFISEASARMSALIRGLLEYSQIGRDSREPKSIDCNGMLEHLRLDLNAAIRKAGAELRWGDLPVVEGYPIELRQLFQNLISNALKFSRPHTTPIVKISGQALGNGWEFRVSDNGIGIPKEQQQRIFEIFKRLHHRSEYEGTGIGLANCKKIVELHNGEIWVESEEGKGSTFVFTLKQTPR